jgi:hypothetical protein
VKVKAMPKMQAPGHYRRRTTGPALPGQYNKPKRGRVGKMMPSMKRLTPKVRRGR